MPPNRPRELLPVDRFRVGLGHIRDFAADHAAPLAGSSEFLDPAAERFIVVAIDTAGGGPLSDEALAVYVVAGERFALLTARVVSLRDERYAVSAVPLVYVLALLETLRTVQRYLRAAQDASDFGRLPFRLPTVLVVLESNFAYGAAVYIQFLRLLDRTRQRNPDVSAMDIVFATPVYTWDAREVARVAVSAAVVQREREEVLALHAWTALYSPGHPQRAGAVVDQAWRDHQRGTTAAAAAAAAAADGTAAYAAALRACLWAWSAVQEAKARKRQLGPSPPRNLDATVPDSPNYPSAVPFDQGGSLRSLPATFWYDAPKSAFGLWTMVSS